MHTLSATTRIGPEAPLPHHATHRHSALRHTRPTRQLGLRALCLAGVAAATLCAAMPAQAAPEDVATALRGLALPASVSRSVTLRGLGFTAPIALSSIDARREFYWPVPANLPISNAMLNLDARYLRADGGQTTFVLSLDGYPVAARAPDQADGSFAINLGVDGAARSSGFLRMGAAWSSLVDKVLCGDNRSPGNVVEIQPDTRLSYSYNPTAITTLLQAWSALPDSVGILVAGKSLGAAPYDAAWRLGVAVERAGKHARFVALPAVGDQVSLAGLSIPPALLAIPAFAALSGQGNHALSNPAEIGAYLLLRGGALAQMAVAEASLVNALQADFTALSAQLASNGGVGKAELDALLARAESLATAPQQADGVAVATLGGQPVIAVAPSAAPKTAALFSAFWRPILSTGAVQVKAAQLPRSTSGTIALTSLQEGPASFDVLARGDWSASFTLSSLSAEGRLPESLSVDVAAAPGASWSAPVASVFLNDYLLGAKRLYADGHAEQITAQIPRYALRPDNVLRVSFQRQPVSDRCRETPQAFPVSVLPSSHLNLASPADGADFIGVVPRLAGASTLLLPTAFLADAPASLETVVRLADTAGLSPRAATLQLANSNGADLPAAAMPERPFLAVDVSLPLADDHRVTVSGDHLLLASDPKTPLLDVSGLQHLASLQAISGKVPGLLYRRIGAQGPALAAPLTLSTGDIALVSDGGKVVEINSHDPAGDKPAVAASQSWSLSRLWQTPGAWGIIGFAVVALLIVLLVLRAAAVRKRRERD